MPRAYSGHLGYSAWGPPASDTAPALVVGQFDDDWMSRTFTGCRRAARLDNGLGVDLG